MPTHPVVAEIIGWEFLLVIGLVALLFGSSQIPKFAKSIGEASRELKKGMAEGAADDPPAAAATDAPAAPAPAASDAPAEPAPPAAAATDAPASTGDTPDPS